jgi:hypothetical protein
MNSPEDFRPQGQESQIHHGVHLRQDRADRKHEPQAAKDRWDDGLDAVREFNEARATEGNAKAI